MTEHKPIESWLTDMDGVLIHEGVPIPGADAFIKKLREFRQAVPRADEQLDLHTPATCMCGSPDGPEVPVENIWTSALATAKFLEQPAAWRHCVRHR